MAKHEVDKAISITEWPGEYKRHRKALENRMKTIRKGAARKGTEFTKKLFCIINQEEAILYIGNE